MDERDLLDRLRGLFTHAPVAIAVNRGAELVYQLANEVYRMFLGGADLVGKPLDEVLPENASLRGILHRVFESAEPYQGKEFPFLVNRSGTGEWTERRWFNFICQPMHGPRGVDGVVTFAVDVTDQVVARQQIEALAAELRQAVHARDEFIAIASHELRTPLTPILLQTQRLQRTSSDEDLQRRLTVISRNVDRMDELIGQLLDVSRITADRLQLSLAELDLVALVREVIERLQGPLESSGSTLSLEADSVISGTWDRLRVDQVVTNLVGNAIKYGRGQPITVRLRAADGRVTIAVEDRGIGIAPADQARIFERFERAVSVRHYGGFGLGLWIVRQLAEALGGSIAVDSEVGRGSTFTVELPHHS